MRIPEKRRIEIKNLIQQEKSVSVERISELFNISLITVRRDLERLQEQGYISKVHGGALIRDSLIPEPVFNVNIKLNQEEKNRIAIEAAKRINNGDSVILESGSTCLNLVRYLSEKNNLKISTAGISLANELLKLIQIKNDFEVSVCGGIIRAGSSTYVGPHAVSYFKSINADIAFLGAVAVSASKGLSTATQFDAEIANAIAESARKIILLADSSKFERHSYINFLPIERLSEIITDDKINEEIAKEITKKGVKLTTV